MKPCKPNTIQVNPCQSGSDPNETQLLRSRVNAALTIRQGNYGFALFIDVGDFKISYHGIFPKICSLSPAEE